MNNKGVYYVSPEAYEALVNLKKSFNKETSFLGETLSALDRKYRNSIEDEINIVNFLTDHTSISIHEEPYFWYSKQLNKYIGRTLTDLYGLTKSKAYKYTESELKANSLYDLSKFERQMV